MFLYSNNSLWIILSKFSKTDIYIVILHKECIKNYTHILFVLYFISFLSLIKYLLLYLDSILNITCNVILYMYKELYVHYSSFICHFSFLLSLIKYLRLYLRNSLLDLFFELTFKIIFYIKNYTYIIHLLFILSLLFFNLRLNICYCI